MHLCTLVLVAALAAAAPKPMNQVQFSGYNWSTRAPVGFDHKSVWVDEDGLHLAPRHIHHDDEETESWWNIDLSLDNPFINASGVNEVEFDIEFGAPFLSMTEDAMLEFSMLSMHKRNGIYLKIARADNSLIIKHNNDPTHPRKDAKARSTIYVDEVNKIHDSRFVHRVCMKRAPLYAIVKQQTNNSMLSSAMPLLESEYSNDLSDARKNDKARAFFMNARTLHFRAHSSMEQLPALSTKRDEIIITRFIMRQTCGGRDPDSTAAAAAAESGTAAAAMIPAPEPGVESSTAAAALIPVPEPGVESSTAAAALIPVPEPAVESSTADETLIPEPEFSVESSTAAAAMIPAPESGDATMPDSSTFVNGSVEVLPANLIVEYKYGWIVSIIILSVVALFLLCTATMLIVGCFASRRARVTISPLGPLAPVRMNSDSADKSESSKSSKSSEKSEKSV
jgi:hypothetical protein